MTRRAAALILLVASACTSSGDPVVRRSTESPSPSPTSTATAIALTHWTASDAPPRHIVAARDDQIVILASPDGSTVRTVADLRPGAGLVHISLSLSPDGKTAYLTRARDEMCFEVISVDLGTGRLTRIANGSSPAVNPDGSTLAYMSADNCGDRRQRVIARDLKTGRERTWQPRKRAEGGFGGLIWAPDPRYLLVEECGFDSCGPFLLDTTRTDGVLSGRPYGPPGAGLDGELKVDGYQTAMNAHVARPVRRTLVFGIHYPNQPPDARYPIFEFNPKTGESVPIINSVVPAGPLDFDATGDHLLYIGQDGELFRYDGMNAVSLGLGFSGAAW